MDLLTIILVLVVCGVVLWAVNKWIPMDATVKKILNIAVIIGLIIWLLQGLGVFNGLHTNVHL